MQGRVVSFFLKALSCVAVWFEKSVLGRVYNRFCAWCFRVYRTSRTSRFFANAHKTDWFSHSVLGKLCSLPAALLLFLQQKLSAPIQRVLESSFVCNGFSQWADISIRFYGIVCIVFSTLLLIFQGSGKVAVVLCFLLFGVLMFVINRSLKQLFGGSSIVKAIVGLFGEWTKDVHECRALKKTETIVATLLGVLLSLLYLAVGVKLFVLLVCGTLAFVALLRYLPLGVFLTVIFSPMLPTMVLVGLSLLCTFVFCIHVVVRKDHAFCKTPMYAPVVFFIIALLWGCMNSFSFTTSVSQVAVHISFILFYFVIVNTIQTKQQWMALVKLFLVSAFFVALYGVVQNFTGVQSTESWVDEEMFADIKVRVYSFFNNPNVLGEFLVMTIPMTVALIWGKAKNMHKALYTFVLISMIACMIFTWSRGAWLGVFLACALFFVIMDKRWVLVGILGLMLLPVLLVISGNTAILERLFSIGNTADTSTAYRVSIWQAAIHIIRDYWLCGIGVGSEAYKSVYPVYALSGADFALHSHNLYLQIWVEMGIVGIVSLFSVIISFIKEVFSESVIQLRKKDNAAKLVIALGAGLIGYMFQGLTDYVWYNYKILMIYWIILALGISGKQILTRPKKPEGGDSVK